MSKTVLFQAIQFSISIQFSSIWPIDKTLSGATILSQSRPRSYGNKGILHTPQSSSITGTSPSDCFVSYLGHSLGGGLTPLQRCSCCILLPQPTWQSTNCKCIQTQKCTYKILINELLIIKFLHIGFNWCVKTLIKSYNTKTKVY